MKTNRRNFIKNVAYLLSGALASISGFVSAALPMTSVPKAKGLSAQDICNEALEKIGHKRIPKFHPSDRVCISATMPESMKHFEKDKDATVIYSETTQDGHGIEGGTKIIYVLEIDGVGRRAWYPEELLTKIGTLVERFDSRQRYEIGTRLVTHEGFQFRYIREPVGIILLGKETTRPFWRWIPDNEFVANPPEEYLTMLKLEL